MSKQSNKPYSILYIAGYGHSGTTILDILLGSTPDAFSIGELTHLVRPGFLKEYCSCNTPIEECTFWSEVYERWHKKIHFSPEEYRALRHAFDNNKTYFSALRGRFAPSAKFLRYAELTEALYDAIHEVSGAAVLIDSSKSPSRPLVLSHFAPVRLLHVKRNFSGVANSEQKDIRVDLSKGLEAASPPKALHKVFAGWLTTNLFCTLSSLLLGGESVHFRRWIARPRELQKIADFRSVDLEEGLFKPAHMIAGNAIRLKPPQRIEPRHRTSYGRLSPRQAALCAWVDRLFWFYA